MRLLLAEDDMSLAEAIKKVLILNKYDVDVVYNGVEAVNYVFQYKYDAIILDIMMPKLNGIEVVKRIRTNKVLTPVLMLTALSEVDDKVTGLDAGADDYLTKPFVVKELLARIRALIRRTKEETEEYKIGNVILNSNTYELIAEGKLRLTNKEFKLMELLIKNKDRYISTELIMDNVWEFDFDVEINVVWVFISNLRKKLESINANYTIKSVRGVGYRLEATL